MEQFKLNVDATKFKIAVTYFRKTIGQESVCVKVAIDELINKSSTTEYINSVEELRKIDDDNERDKAKSEFPCFTPHAILRDGATTTDIVDETNFLFGDADFRQRSDSESQFPIIQGILEPHLIFLRYSITGRGLHFLILIDDPAKRVQYIDLINEKLKPFGYQLDEHFRDNIVQKAIVTSGKDQFLNSNPIPFAGVFNESTTVPATVSTKKVEQRKSSGRNETKEKKPNFYRGLVGFLQKRYTITRDDLTGIVRVNGRVLNDEILNSLTHDALMNEHYCTKDHITMWVNSLYVSKTHAFNDFIKKYEHLHPTGNIEKLAKTLIVEPVLPKYPNFVEDAVKYWLVKMVAQVYEEQANELGLFFVGPQNIGKTEWFRRLFPSELKPLFAEIPFKVDKDFKVACSKYLLIFDDELKGKKAEDSDALKRIFSAVYVNVRKVYGTTDYSYKKIASFCGAGNDPQILKDPSGNRRFICLLLKNINRTLYNETEKVSLFKEVYDLYKGGFDLETPQKLVDAIQESSAPFEVHSIEEEILLDQYPPARPGVDDPQSIYWWPVFHLLEVMNKDRSVKLREYQTAIALRKLNYPSKYQQVGRSKLRVYAVRLAVGGDYGLRIEGENILPPMPGF
jgi:hypothetical protein